MKYSKEIFLPHFLEKKVRIKRNESNRCYEKIPISILDHFFIHIQNINRLCYIFHYFRFGCILNA